MRKFLNMHQKYTIHAKQVDGKGKKFVIFDDLPETIACEQTVWLEFAHHLVYGAAKGSDSDEVEKLLKEGTVTEYMRKCMWTCRAKWGNKPQHKLFFAEIDLQQDPGNWWKLCLRQVIPLCSDLCSDACSSSAISSHSTD